MDFKLSDLEYLFERFQNIIEYIDSKKIKRNECNIYLGNNEKFKYSIQPNRIPHLIGINTTYLVSSGYVRSKNSYEAFIEMVNKGAYSLYQAINGNGSIKLNINELFSEYIKDKIEIFFLNIGIDINETILVCKHDTKKDYIFGNKYEEKCDYVILKNIKTKDDFNYIGALFLIKDKYFAIPMSSRKYENLDEALDNLSGVITNQEVTILTRITTNNDYKCNISSIYLNKLEKVYKVNKLMDIKSKYSCIIDVSSDYKYELTRANTFKDYSDDNSQLANIIIKHIIEGTIIEFTSNSEMLNKIIDSWNDHITSNINSTNNEITYVKALKELKSAKELINTLTDENNNLTNTCNNLKNQNNILINENNNLNDIKNKVLELVKPKNEQ